MRSSISRDDAIAIICEIDLSKLTTAERAEQLDAMMEEDWRAVPGWADVPFDVRADFEMRAAVERPADSRYDPVLMVWLRDGYAAVRNEFLAKLLRDAGHDFDAVVGEPVPFIPCPCCGLCTLENHEDVDICIVCAWENDGQDNADANVVRRGANLHLSLTRARINFLISGICDPAREDFRQWLEPAEKYVRGREFVLSDDLSSVSEPATNWQGALKDEHDWSFKGT